MIEWSSTTADDFLLKSLATLEHVVPLQPAADFAISPLSFVSQTALLPCAGASSLPSTVIFSRHFWSVLPSKHALWPEKKTTSLSVSPVGTVTFSAAPLGRFVYDVEVVAAAVVLVAESTSATK